MKILVVQGAGMNMRGKTQTDIFGTMTLEQYDQHIVQYAADLDIEVEIFHSNIEGEVIDRLYAANDQGFEGGCGWHHALLCVSAAAEQTLRMAGPIRERLTCFSTAPISCAAFGMP